jgi:iduronate 2-sulfatase
MKPNILFILVDDLGNYIGPYGDVYADTPNLDEFAKTSTTFINHHVQVPVCGASRTSMLFGRRPEKTGVMNFEPFRNSKTKSMKTLPEELREIGYTTHSIGKVVDHAQWGRPTSRTSVREKCDGKTSPCSWDTTYSYSSFDNEVNKCDPQTTTKYAYKVTGDDSRVEDECLINNTTQLIDSLSGKPWFIAVGLNKPHLPWSCTEADYAEVADIQMEKQLINKGNSKPNYDLLFRTNDEIIEQYDGYNNKKTITAEEGYYACVRQTDRMIGKLLRKVSDYDNLLIIIWGDNGFHVDSPNGMVGKKTLFRHSTATPLIIQYPNYFDKGEKVIIPVESIDILPTIAEITSMNMNPDWDGKSLTILSNRTWAQTRYSLYGPGLNRGYGIAYNGQNPYETYIKFFSMGSRIASRLTYSANIITETPIEINIIPAIPANYTFSPSKSPTKTNSPVSSSPTRNYTPSPIGSDTPSPIGSDMIVIISVASIATVFLALFIWYRYTTMNRRKSFILLN